MRMLSGVGITTSGMSTLVRLSDLGDPCMALNSASSETARQRHREIHRHRQAACAPFEPARSDVELGGGRAASRVQSNIPDTFPVERDPVSLEGSRSGGNFPDAGQSFDPKEDQLSTVGVRSNARDEGSSDPSSVRLLKEPNA